MTGSNKGFTKKAGSSKGYTKKAGSSKGDTKKAGSSKGDTKKTGRYTRGWYTVQCSPFTGLLEQEDRENCGLANS